MFTFANLQEMGQLGNQLFRVAAVIGAARQHDTKFVLPAWPVSRHMEGFPFPLMQPSEHWETYREPGFRFQPIPPPAPGGTSLLGYFQSWKYFSHCLEEVRSYIGPSFQCQVTASARFGPGIAAPHSASIHVRRGDYHTWAQKHYFHLEASQYYKRAMREAGMSRTHWYVFSDDPEWCRQNFSAANVSIVDAGPEPYLDLVAMSLCRSNVIANSTFSWWAAMLNSYPDARIYCPEPSNWFAGEHAVLDTTDLLPPHWVRVGAD